MDKITKICCIAAASVVALIFLVFAGVMVYEITAPTLSEEEAKAYILKQIEPQVKQMREEYDIPDLRVEVELYNYEFRKPVLYKDGKFMIEAGFSCEYYDYYISESFSEFDEAEENHLRRLSQKYDALPQIDYNIDTMRYSVKMIRPYDDDAAQGTFTKHRFATKAGNFYYIGEYDLYKNGEAIYQLKDVLHSSSPSTSEKCVNCNGTGYVKYYYGDSDLQAYLEGHDPYTVGKCTSCNGTGKTSGK